MPILSMEGISKSFPGVRALDAVDFDLERGDVHALVGYLQIIAQHSQCVHRSSGAARVMWKQSLSKSQVFSQQLRLLGPLDDSGLVHPETHHVFSLEWASLLVQRTQQFQ